MSAATAAGIEVVPRPVAMVDSSSGCATVCDVMRAAPSAAEIVTPRFDSALRSRKRLRSRRPLTAPAVMAKRAAASSWESPSKQHRIKGSRSVSGKRSISASRIARNSRALNSSSGSHDLRTGWHDSAARRHRSARRASTANRYAVRCSQTGSAAGRLNGGRLARQRQECGLKDVIGVELSGDAAGHAQDQRAMALDQRAKGVRVAAVHELPEQHRVGWRSNGDEPTAKGFEDRCDGHGAALYQL